MTYCTESHQAWHPGVLAAGALHPECRAWPLPMIEHVIEEAARGGHPDMEAGQLRSLIVMRSVAKEADEIIKGVMA